MIDVRSPAVIVAASLLACPSLATPAGDVVLKAKLTGTYLHTSPSGSGTATLTFKASQVCWQLTWKGTGKVQESGIHQTPPPPADRRKHSVVPFKAVTTHRGCVTAPAATIAKITAKPSGYYVDIHSTKYPAGAIGGRLRRA